MDLEKKYNLKKSKLILLFIQMILTIILLITSIYLLIFVISNNLGGWMITSYIFITMSIISIIIYSCYGYKKGDIAYQVSILPFLGAILINIIIPNRNAFQIAVLTVLFALTFGFLLKQNEKKISTIISILMVIAALIFSTYSAITADTQFLGSISNHWYTYLSMYLSIFIPTIMSGTIALTYNVRSTRASKSDT